MLEGWIGWVIMPEDEALDMKMHKEWVAEVMERIRLVNGEEFTVSCLIIF